MSGCTGRGAISPQNVREFLNPVSFGALLASFQALEKCAVGDFSLAIGLGMIYGGELLSDAQLVTPRVEGVVGELLAVVTKDDARDDKAANYILPNKLEDVMTSDGGEGFGLNPFGKVIHRNN